METQSLLASLAVALGLVLCVALCVIRKKRRLEGEYRPSAEEQRQARGSGLDRPGLPLPLPKEERLI